MKTTHLVLSLLALTALVGCNKAKPGESKEESQPEETESVVSEEESLPVESEEESESEEEVSSNPLEWQQVGNTAYVNIYGNIGATLLYNNNEFGNGDYIHFGVDRVFDYLGVFTSNTVFNFVFVLQNTSGEEVATTCIVNPAIESEHVGEYLIETASAYLLDQNKGYIAISMGEEVNWDHNKSQAMNNLIQNQIDLIKDLG